MGARQDLAQTDLFFLKPQNIEEASATCLLKISYLRLRREIAAKQVLCEGITLE